MNLPKARTENIVVQNLEKEILIYDLSTDQAFCLNETAAIIYQACSSAAAAEELKTKHDFSDEIIYLALGELKRENLIQGSYVSPFAGMSRREIVRRAGLASMAALPVIASLVAPTAINAASQCVNTGGQAPNTTVKVGAFAGCFADCSSPVVTSKCCRGSARATGIVCDSGPPERTTCLCD